MNQQLQQALRALPSQGRGSNWVSRRDRALLVLHGAARLSCQNITELTAVDVTIADGTATITTKHRTITLTSDADDVLCAPCTLARWLRTLEMTVVYPDQRVPTAVISRGAPLAAQSPHACDGTIRCSPALQHHVLLPDIDQWGLIPPPATARHHPLPGAAAQQLPHQRTGQPDRQTRAQQLESRARWLLNHHEAAANGAVQVG